MTAFVMIPFPLSACGGLTERETFASEGGVLFTTVVLRTERVVSFFRKAVVRGDRQQGGNKADFGCECRRSTMVPPELESIADELVKRYESSVRKNGQGGEGLEVAELLTAEEQVKDFVFALGQSMLQSFVDVRVNQAKARRQPCTCGRVPTVHRTTGWTRQTPFGPVTVRDPYVYCPDCHESARPLHALLGTDRETWSLIIEEAAVDLASDESCGKAVAKLERHHPGVEMDRTTALRMLHEHGNKARAFINDKLAEARHVAEQPPAIRPQGAEELEVQFDGGMIPVATLLPIEVPDGEEPELTPVRGLPKRRRECRWEEAKVGLVQKPGEVDRLYSVQPTTGLEKSFNDLFALACIKGWDEQTQVRGLSDGARHIRPRMEEVFDIGNFRFILDRPHCKEHLSSAGEALEPMTGMPAQKWAEDALEKLEAGQSAAVAAELKRAWKASGPDQESRNDTLRLEAGYFERNHDAVAYAFYRSQGWSTASSEVESGHRHVVQVRVKISGAWWHPDHVDDILALRMLKANGWWDEYWDSQRAQWRRRATNFAKKTPT
jgi:hypothetical protein